MQDIITINLLLAHFSLVCNTWLLKCGIIARSLLREIDSKMAGVAGKFVKSGLLRVQNSAIVSQVCWK